MNARYRHLLYIFAAVGWLSAVGWGARGLWRFDSAAGAPALAPPAWPAVSSPARDRTLPTLVVLVHPKCPCSRATISELSLLMTECAGKLQAKVVMIHPEGMPPGWERTDLWTSAAAIPGVVVTSDLAGADCRLFGAQTSGQALLYDADGRLLFQGGITESRGHCGDNAGRSAIVALVNGSTGRHPGAPAHTPVYGCPLFGAGVPCSGKETRCIR